MALCGCKSDNPKKKSPRTSTGKESTILRFFYVINPDGTDRCMQVPIYRSRPMMYWIDKNPFLHEGFITEATLVEEMGTIAIMVKFDSSGSLLMENVSLMNKGRNIAIYGEFGEARWLSAPMLTGRVSDGVFVFTPDASKEEAERIVRGLNNNPSAIKKKKKKK